MGEYAIKLFTQHTRFWIAVLAGFGSFFLLPRGWALDVRLLASWDGGVVLFLLMMYLWMRKMSAADIQTHYAEEDPSGPVILVVVIAASLLSVLAIVEPLATLRHVVASDRVGHLLIAGATLTGSWLLVPTMFTARYADLFYSTDRDHRPLAFPDTAMPTFADFAYFSFTIAAACQTADVSTTRAAIRRVVLIHAIISFAFNAAIIGFAINITAGLISG